MVALGYIISLFYAGLTVLAGFISHKAGMPKRYSRKIVHVLIGAEWFILYSFMGAGFDFFAVCLICTVALALEYKMKIIPSMSSDSDNAPGTVYYGVAMTALSLISIFVPRMIYPFGIAVLCTSLGDGAAGIFGQLLKRYTPKLVGEKTLVGFLANLCVSFASTAAFSFVFALDFGILECVLIAIISAGLELVSKRGLDNLTVTLGVALLSFVLIDFPYVADYTLALAMLPAVIGIVYEKRALTPGGIVAASALALSASAAFGNSGFITLLVYFVLSVFTDKIKKKAKKTKQSYGIDNLSAFEKQSSEFKNNGTRRDFYQVFANGICAFIAALLFFAFPLEIYAVAFAAALAESLSDTSASGIGALSTGAYDPFRRCYCMCGESGGVSFAGTLGALIFSSAFALICVLLGIVSCTGALIVAICAFLGMLIDSMIGSLLQARYECSICGKTTENSCCCSASSKLKSGLKFMTNSTVNLVSSIASVLLAVLLYFVF